MTVQAPIHYSNVALIDPVTKGAVRVQWRFLEDGTKVGQDTKLSREDLSREAARICQAFASVVVERCCRDVVNVMASGMS